MRHYGDICGLSGATLEPVDCVIGGSPCQDLSVAGKRAGLGGERSSLFLEQIRIVKELRDADKKRGRPDHLVRPRHMVWENVPGALSSNKGEDFRRVLEECARISDPSADVPRPPGGTWKPVGVIMGNGWSITWRVLDAQYWGVPQRRRRIALVCDFGDESAPEILFEREGVQGCTAPSGAAGQGTAEGAAGRADMANQLDGTWPKTARSLICRQDGSPCVDRGSEIVVSGFAGTNANELIAAFQQNQRDEVRLLGGCAGSIAAQNGTKQQTYVVTAGFNGHRAATAEIEFAEERAPGMVASMPPNVVAGFKSGQGDKAGSIGFAEETAPTIGGVASGTNQVPAAMCCRTDQTGSNGLGVSEDIAHTLDGAAGQAIAFDARHDRITAEVGTLKAKGSGGMGLQDTDPVLQRGIVRRLTPLECERLQGYPDGWTDIKWTPPHRKSPERAKDSPRYKALGNSIALPPWRWVLSRICAQHDRPATLGSLFDGIGGFPLLWEEINGAGSCRWASEVEPFCVAVTKARFSDG